MKKSAAFRDIVQLLLSLFIVGVLVAISTVYFFRIDLTTEKRHTLADSTVEFLEELDEIIYVKVYLKGEYPAMFQKLERATREKLHEMRAYSGGNLEFEFINPADIADDRTRNENYQKLV